MVNPEGIRVGGASVKSGQSVDNLKQKSYALRASALFLTSDFTDFTDGGIGFSRDFPYILLIFSGKIGVVSKSFYKFTIRSLAMPIPGGCPEHDTISGYYLEDPQNDPRSDYRQAQNIGGYQHI